MSKSIIVLLAIVLLCLTSTSCQKETKSLKRFEDKDRKLFGTALLAAGRLVLGACRGGGLSMLRGVGNAATAVKNGVGTGITKTYEGVATVVKFVNGSPLATGLVVATYSGGVLALVSGAVIHFLPKSSSRLLASDSTDDIMSDFDENVAANASELPAEALEDALPILMSQNADTASGDFLLDEIVTDQWYVIENEPGVLTTCGDVRPEFCTISYDPVCLSECSADSECQTQYMNACLACMDTNVISYVGGQCESSQ